MADEITCLIADDHEVVREGLRLALSRSARIRVIGEANDGASAVAMTERRRPDVVIMDLRMPDMDGLEATEVIAEKVPGTAVLIFTVRREVATSARARSVAPRLHPQGDSTRDADRAIEKVASGETFVDPGLMAEFVSGKGTADILTPREREILQLLADGMSNVDVADKLFISQETVKSHARCTSPKLEADMRPQAVAIALREAMIY